jgi:glycosyltransferase involved in cell wall biosynthesis
VLRRIVRSFLDSQPFAQLAQSTRIWSILRWLPRSVRYHAKALSHKALGTELSPYPAVESTVKPWPKHRPVLSVIVPCHNYGQYVREALKSVSSQTFTRVEIIVVDDGSTDSATLHVLESLRQEGIRVLRQEHSGPARTLNLGISAASGKYFCCLSADDRVEPTYFEKCLFLLESNPGISFAYSLIRTFGRDEGVGVTQPFNLGLLLAYNHVCGSAVVLKKAWEAVGGFDPLMPAYVDWDFWIRLGKRGFRGKLIPEPLFNWRRHSNALGKRADEKRPELVSRIRANHADLYLHPKLVEAIQRNYRDYRVSDPFTNVSYESQYLKGTVPLGLIISARPSPVNILPTFRDFVADLRDHEGCDFLSVVTTQSSRRWEGELSKISRHVYNLADFLDTYCWLDFVVNLISTRHIRLVLLAGSKLVYNWTPKLKKQFPLSVVDVLSEAGEGYAALSGEFDPFIDYHVAFSESISKCLANDFRIPEAKIRVFHAQRIK